MSECKLPYRIDGKYAIVTGAGSGICHVFAKRLLEGGCSVMIADIQLREEAQQLLDEWPPGEGKKAAAYYQKTDVSDWAQLNSLWYNSLEIFGKIHMLCNGAAIYEPPSSDFWKPPGDSPLAEDKADASPGGFKTIAVNTEAPIRLAQIAIFYWLKNKHLEGNLLFVASLGAYVSSMQTPLYFASKAAIVSIVNSLGPLRQLFGIRIASICPGAVDTPIFHPEYCRDRVRPGDWTLNSDQCAKLMMSIVTEPEYGDGDNVEILRDGPKETDISIRRVPSERLHPASGPVGKHNSFPDEEQKHIDRVKAMFMGQQSEELS